MEWSEVAAVANASPAVVGFTMNDEGTELWLNCQGMGNFGWFEIPEEALERIHKTEIDMGHARTPVSMTVSPVVVKEFVEVLQKYLDSVCTCGNWHTCPAHEAINGLSAVLKKMGAS